MTVGAQITIVSLNPGLVRAVDFTFVARDLVLGCRHDLTVKPKILVVFRHGLEYMPLASETFVKDDRVARLDLYNGAIIVWRKRGAARNDQYALRRVISVVAVVKPATARWLLWVLGRVPQWPLGRGLGVASCDVVGASVGDELLHSARYAHVLMAITM